MTLKIKIQVEEERSYLLLVIIKPKGFMKFYQIGDSFIACFF